LQIHQQLKLENQIFHQFDFNHEMIDDNFMPDLKMYSIYDLTILDEYFKNKENKIILHYICPNYFLFYRLVDNFNSNNYISITETLNPEIGFDFDFKNKFCFQIQFKIFSNILNEFISSIKNQTGNSFPSIINNKNIELVFLTDYDEILKRKIK
jgi:hypothetical protein